MESTASTAATERTVSCLKNLKRRSLFILLRKTVRSLKSPTGAFIDSLRSSNANCFNFICDFMASAFFQLSRVINTSFSIVDVEQNASFFAAVSDGTAQFKKLDVSLNFSAKVRYNYVTETDRAREGTETGADGP